MEYYYVFVKSTIVLEAVLTINFTLKFILYKNSKLSVAIGKIIKMSVISKEFALILQKIDKPNFIKNKH